jgi:hypothetical protein
MSATPSDPRVLEVVDRYRTCAVWTLRPERIVGGAGSVNPLALVREIRRARGYLEKRSLPRPTIA